MITAHLVSFGTICLFGNFVDSSVYSGVRSNTQRKLRQAVRWYRKKLSKLNGLYFILSFFLLFFWIVSIGFSFFLFFQIGLNIKTGGNNKTIMPGRFVIVIKLRGKNRWRRFYRCGKRALPFSDKKETSSHLYMEARNNVDDTAKKFYKKIQRMFTNHERRTGIEKQQTD